MEMLREMCVSNHVVECFVSLLFQFSVATSLNEVGKRKEIEVKERKHECYVLKKNFVHTFSKKK